MDVIQLSSKKFMAGCLAVAVAVLFIGRSYAFSPLFIGAEVLLTILSLFLLGSFKYQVHKNALTYGAMLVIGATFFTGWWPQSGLKASLAAEGSHALIEFAGHHLLTLHGLDELIHADTMLFILGLTFFVSVIAQTRMLESMSFAILKKNKGLILPTVAILTGLVAIASGVLDGVSMIGLMIRTLVIILFLAKAQDEAVIFSVIVSTLITTVCGMWLAYGEPPNLIMKANLHPYLTNGFFLRYCLPAAVGSYLIVYWNIRKRLKGKKVDLAKLGVLELRIADVRFYQASKYGEVLDPSRNSLFGEGEEVKGNVEAVLDQAKEKRIRAQWIGALSFIPFVGFLIWHGVDHTFPLFWASFAGFAVALIGIYTIPKMRKLAIHEAVHEYKEYLFLFPLFLSITLLQKSGFFDGLSALLHQGIETLGTFAVAFIQFAGAVFLSALLDNNVVADFASRALHNLDIGMLHLFSMAQIAGYAVGGCWTHIGSAQSVVAFAFIKREINKNYTPVQWMKAMTGVILQIFVLMAILIAVENYLMKWLH